MEKAVGQYQRHKQKAQHYAHEGYVHNIIRWSTVNEDSIETEVEGHCSTMQAFHNSCEGQTYSQTICMDCGI